MDQPSKNQTKDQEFHVIVKKLKQWHDSNNVNTTLENYQKLVQVVHHVYYPLKELLEEAQLHIQQQASLFSNLEIQYFELEQQNNNLKRSLNSLQQKKRDLQRQMQQSSLMLHREISQLSMDHSVTENLQRDKQKLEQTLKNRQSEFESLQANYFHLTIQLTERNQKEKKLRGNYEQLKSERDIYKIKKEILQSNNEELKRQVQFLKNLIDNKKNFMLKYAANQIVQSQSNRDQKSFVESQEGQYQRYADRSQLNQLQANYGQQYVRSQRSKSNYLLSENDYLEDYSVSKKSEEDSLSKIPDKPSVVPQIQRKNNMKKKFFSSFHEKLTPQLESRHISIDTPANKIGLMASLRKGSQDQMQMKEDQLLKVKIVKQDRLIQMLKEEIQQYKRKGLNRLNLPRRRDMSAEDMADLSEQLQSMNNKLKQSRKQIFELKTQKQYYEMLCQSMQNQRVLEQKAYKELLLEKMKQLFNSERNKFHNKQKILKDKVQKLEYFLERTERKEKSKIHREHQELTPLDIQGFQGPSVLNTSRHNISDDEFQSEGQEKYNKNLIIRGNLNMSGDFLEIQEEDLKKKDQQHQQCLDNAELSFESNDSSHSVNAYAQTDQVFVFSDENQYRKGRFRYFYLTQEQVQTQKSSDQREDVGIQVLFSEECDMQTQKTCFIDTLQYTQQTFESSNKCSQTQQKSYIEQTKNNSFEDKSSPFLENILQNQGDSFALPDRFEIINASHQGLNFTFRNQQEIDQKTLDIIKGVEEINQHIRKKQSIRKPILRTDLCFETSPITHTQRKFAKTPQKIQEQSEIKTQRKISCNFKISRQLIWEQSDGSIKSSIIRKSILEPSKTQYKADEIKSFSQTDKMISIDCQTDKPQKSDFAVQVSSQNSSQKSNSQNSHQKNIIKLKQQIWSTPIAPKNQNTTINSTNNSLSSTLLNLRSEKSGFYDHNLMKEKPSNREKEKIPSWKLFEKTDHMRTRSKSDMEEQPKHEKIYQYHQIEEQLYRLDSSRLIEGNSSSQQKEKQQYDYSNIHEILRQLPWKNLEEWSSIKPTSLTKCEDNQPQKWNNKLCYVFEAVNKTGNASKFFVWKKGVYCINDGNVLRLSKKGTICKQPGNFLIGNSEITIIKGQMLIRKKGKNGCVIGEIENGNWTIDLKSRQCFKICD